MAIAPPEFLRLAMSNDSGPFIRLGGQFRCNGVVWNGVALASPTAIYLLKNTKVDRGRSGGGGLACALIYSAFDDANKDDFISNSIAEDLPDKVRAYIDFGRKRNKKGIIVIHKDAVSLVKAGGLNNVIALQMGSDVFCVYTNIFRMFAKPKALATMGWTLNQPLIPTAAPPYDSNAGLTVLDKKPIWQRILLLVGGIALIIGMIALRVLLRR